MIVGRPPECCEVAQTVGDGLVGLAWLLQGRPVVTLTAETAAILTASGGILTYRKHNKPALGAAVYSLDDFDGAEQ